MMPERRCEKCDVTTLDMFCPKCGSLTTFIQNRAPPKSKRGETFIVSISQGANFSRGLRVKKEDRKKYFNKREETVILHLDDERCVATLPKSFWGSSADIKVAKDHKEKNYLTKWMEKHGLLPISLAEKRKGRPDLLFMIVAQPEMEFKVRIPTEEELQELIQES